jgi:hypothetical protein
MSDDQRTKIINSAIDILRTKNAGREAEIVRDRRGRFKG